MSCKSQVDCHPRKHAIEAMLAARAPLAVIAATFGISRFSAGRHRKHLKAKDTATWRALRREVTKAGLTRQSLIDSATLIESKHHD